MAREKTFVIRIWYEYSETEEIKPQLRGVIKNSANGQEKYISDTNNIHHFIQPFLPQTTRVSDRSIQSASQRIKR